MSASDLRAAIVDPVELGPPSYRFLMRMTRIGRALCRMAGSRTLRIWAEM
jgi:hypothetical protein